MICPRTSDRGRRCRSDTTASPGTAPETGYTALLARADGLGEIDWNVSVDSTINRAHRHGANLTGDAGGIVESQELLLEPADLAVGRSRGGLGTKIRHVCDGKGRPLVLLLGPGQANDSPMFSSLMDAIRVPGSGPGRPRTRLNAVLADKGYSSRGNRALLGSRGIKAVIGEPSYQTRAPHALVIKVAALPR